MKWFAVSVKFREVDAEIRCAGQRFQLLSYERGQPGSRAQITTLGYYDSLASAKAKWWRYNGRGYHWQLVVKEPVR